MESRNTAGIITKLSPDQTNQELIQGINTGLAEQDEMIDQLHDVVGRLKNVAIAIGDEIDTQDKLLDELDDAVDKTASNLRHNVKKVEKLEKEPSLSYCTIC